MKKRFNGSQATQSDPRRLARGELGHMIVLSTILAVALSPTVVPGQDQPPADARPAGLKGPVRKMVEHIVLFDIDDDDRPVESERLPVRSIWFYKNGKISREVTKKYTEEEYQEKTERKYDWKGRITNSATFEPNGTCSHRQRFRYDKQGRLIGSRDTMPQDEMGSESKFSYGKNGLKKQTIDHGPGNLKQAFTCKVEKGRCVERTETVGGRPGGKTTFRYDDTGRVLEEAKYRNDQLKSRQTRRYDARGHLAEESSFGPDNKLTERKTYERDPGGRVLESARYGTGEKPVERLLFKYDPHGELIEQRGFDESGELVQHQVCELSYDQRGNWTRKDCEEQIEGPGDGDDQHRRRTIEYY